MFTSPQLASFEAALTPSSTRGVLLGRKENVLILWLARCEAIYCALHPPHWSVLRLRLHQAPRRRFIRPQGKCSYSVVGSL
jgi:hypothetical protein